MKLSVALAALTTLAAAQQNYQGYKYSKGACRGGQQAANNAGLKLYYHKGCKDMCDKDDACTGFVLPVGAGNWCETYKSVGAVGDGRNFACYMKTDFAAKDKDLKVDGYKYSKGACRGGKTPALNAGLKFWSDRNCKNRCDEDDTCTGYVLPMTDANWCETYKSDGAAGDGRSFHCYMKEGFEAKPTPAPKPTPKPTVPEARGYVYSKGACRGGARPQANAGLKFFSDRNCEKRCNDDAKCTGFTLPVTVANWCETYTSPGVQGDGRAFHCYAKPIGPTPAPVPTPKPSIQEFDEYEYSKGACRGGALEANNAGLKFYKDNLCKDRCDEDAKCSGFVLPMVGDAWCETYLSPDAQGDGRDFRCYMKRDFDYNPFEEYTYSKGACRGGQSPGANAGLKFYNDGDCQDRCDKDDKCSGFVLPAIGAKWCETYTSRGAKGDGRNFRCFMKKGSLPPTPKPVPTPQPTVKQFEGYEYSKGACRGGETPAANAGLKFFRDNDCKERCDKSHLCTGFNLPLAEPTWCETYTSKGAKGDGRPFRCYMKKGDHSGDTDAPTPSPTEGEPDVCRFIKKKDACLAKEPCTYGYIEGDKGKKACMMKPAAVEPFDDFDEFSQYCLSLEASMGEKEACIFCLGKYKKGKNGKPDKCAYPKNSKKIKCKKIKDMKFCAMAGCGNKKGKKCLGKSKIQ